MHEIDEKSIKFVIVHIFHLTHTHIGCKKRTIQIEITPTTFCGGVIDSITSSAIKRVCVPQSPLTGDNILLQKCFY